MKDIKPLYEDSTREKANLMISDWRTHGVVEADTLLANTVDHLMKTTDVREYIAISAISDALEKVDPMSKLLSNFAAGMMFGFRYAQYLYEQREIEKIK